MVTQFNLVLHAFVLMDNHYHLLVELREANLSRAVQWLNVSYSLWFNRRHGRSGHLFQGRFKSIIVDASQWGLALSRYVHLNPVRTIRLGLSKSERRSIGVGAAGVPSVALVQQRTAQLRRYRWSSYPAYIGLVRAPAWLECATVLALGGTGQEAARRHYRDYVEAAIREGLAKSPWDELKEQVVLGTQEFLATLKDHLVGDEQEQRSARRLREARPSLVRVIACVEEIKEETWATFRDRHGDPGRDLVLYLGRTACGLKLIELAQSVEARSYAGVAMAVKRFANRLKHDRLLQEMVERVTQLLNVKM